MSGERYADCSVLGVLAADLANPGVGEYDVTPHNKPKIPSVHIDAKHQISRKSGSITIGDKVMLIGSAGDAGDDNDDPFANPKDDDVQWNKGCTIPLAKRGLDAVSSGAGPPERTYNPPSFLDGVKGVKISNTVSSPRGSAPVLRC